MVESVVEIQRFVDALGKDERMEMLVKEAKTPDQIIQIAESAGINISMKQLRFWSKELKAPCFPWAEKGDQWRRNFFS